MWGAMGRAGLFPTAGLVLLLVLSRCIDALFDVVHRNPDELDHVAVTFHRHLHDRVLRNLYVRNVSHRSSEEVAKDASVTHHGISLR